ncbi:unnamed protein product [Colias eurytheme]|nr:unnamed protein product [Colias eurytheme]
MRILFLFGLSFVVIMSILCSEDSEEQSLLRNFEDNLFLWRSKRELDRFNRTESNSTLRHRKLLESFKIRWPVSRWREFKYFTDDYLDLINEHWLQFSPPYEGVQKFLGAVYVLFSTVGCWGNIMVLLMYFK